MKIGTRSILFGAHQFLIFLTILSCCSLRHHPMNEKRLELLLDHARKPHEPDIPFFGIPVSKMTRDELRAAIYLAARELQRCNPQYNPHLDLRKE